MASEPQLTPLKRIAHPLGDVFHGIKVDEPSYAGFGEAYFTTVHVGAVKGWKRHTRMVMNLVVVCGIVRFVLYDKHDPQAQAADALTFTLSPDTREDYARLTVPPGWWMAFQGRGRGLNLILNFASISHDPHEAENRALDAFPFDWCS